MNLSDAEIMMIEQLTYFGGVDDGDKGKTIEEILSVYTESKLAEMDNSGGIDADRAAIVRYLQSNDKLNGLVLQGTMTDDDGKTLALCFTEDIENPVEAVVAFRGTTANEWGDNVEGLNVIETERQLDAKEYIEGLPYSNITVTGHSKGGNKAMYVSICCEKVDRCIAMDAQGFSEEFIEEYESEIADRAELIKNYSVKSDYVHVLLFQIPGTEQIYCEGYRIGNSPDRHHQPFTFFQIDDSGNIICDDGIPIVVTEKNGEPIEEDPSVKMLHEFTTYILNVASDDEKEKIVNVIATAADLFMGDGHTDQELADFLLSSPDELSLVLAYLVKYMDTYDLSVEDIDELLEMLGLNSLNEYIGVDFMGERYGIAEVISLLQDNLTDGENDPLIDGLLFVISKVLKAKDIDFDLKKFWDSTEDKINSIPNVSKKEGIKEPQIKKNNKTNVTAGNTLIVDTNKLRLYADRLESVNRRLATLDKKMNELYTKVGVVDLFYLIQADLMTSYSKKIHKCGIYLDSTANAFEFTERQVKNLF